MTSTTILLGVFILALGGVVGYVLHWTVTWARAVAVQAQLGALAHSHLVEQARAVRGPSVRPPTPLGADKGDAPSCSGTGTTPDSTPPRAPRAVAP